MGPNSTAIGWAVVGAIVFLGIAVLYVGNKIAGKLHVNEDTTNENRRLDGQIQQLRGVLRDVQDAVSTHAEHLADDHAALSWIAPLVRKIDTFLRTQFPTTGSDALHGSTPPQGTPEVTRPRAPFDANDPAAVTAWLRQLARQEAGHDIDLHEPYPDGSGQTWLQVMMRRTLDQYHIHLEESATGTIRPVL